MKPLTTNEPAKLHGRRSASRAYTAVEVLLAMTVLIISSAGVMSMQKAAIQGNLDARKLDIANSVARTWLDRLATDGTMWNSATGLNKTTWLNTLVGAGTFSVPASSGTFSPAFDILGRDVSSVGAAGSTAIYCVRVKVDDIADFATPPGGPGTAGTVPVLLRATVLVYWAKNLLGTAGAVANPICSGPTDVAAQELATPGTYHMIYATESIRRGN
jgi:hypothetical protein